jgi:uncharacterized protein YjbJ (UPF0337 family)
MHQSTKDEVKGGLHQVSGSVKAEIGKATNNPTLQAKGENEKFNGKVQKKVGQVERVLEK